MNNALNKHSPLAQTDDGYLRLVLTIALPIVLQSLVGVGLNMVDTLMIGLLGVDQLAAVGAANRLFYIFMMFCFGLYSGTSIYSAQYWGVKDMSGIHKVFAVKIYLGSLLALIFMGVAILFPDQFISLFIEEAQVKGMAKEYLNIIWISYIFMAISYAIAYICRSFHKLILPTIINLIALIINTILNYGLIFGNFGLPELGIAGAAWATVIARITEMSLLILMIAISKNHPLKAKLKTLLAWDKPLAKQIIKTTLPVLTTEGAWGIGNSMLYMAYGLLGSVALAVTQVAAVINELFQTVFYGVGVSSAVIIGNELGRSQLAKAYQRGRQFIIITLILGVVATVALILSRSYIANFYNFDQQTNQVLVNTLLVYALFIPAKMLSYVLICGVLRGGGDTKYTMYFDIGSIWLMGIPLAFLAAGLWGLPLPMVVALAFSEEIIKCAFMLQRFFSQKWLNVLI